MQERSIKPQHCIYPLSKSGGKLHQRIVILDTVRGFYLVQRRHLFKIDNLEPRGMSNPFSKNFWIWTIY